SPPAPRSACEFLFRVLKYRQISARGTEIHTRNDGAGGSAEDGVDRIRGLPAFDYGPEIAQMRSEVFVSAIDMFHAGDFRDSVGGQPGHDQRGPGADIAGFDGRTGQRIHTDDEGMMPIHPHAGAEPDEFLHEAPAAF